MCTFFILLLMVQDILTQINTFDHYIYFILAPLCLLIKWFSYGWLKLLPESLSTKISALKLKFDFLVLNTPLAVANPIRDSSCYHTLFFSTPDVCFRPRLDNTSVNQTHPTAQVLAARPRGRLVQKDFSLKRQDKIQLLPRVRRSETAVLRSSWTERH